MKTYPINLKMMFMLAAAAMLGIFITRPAYAQENGGRGSKKITLKIVSNDNGKTTVIDTTMTYPDSVMTDSIRKEVDKVMEMGRGHGHARIRMHKMPEGFDYNFEMPCPADCPMSMKDMEDFDFEGMMPGEDMEQEMEQLAPMMRHHMTRSDGGRQSLSDILGDIPMDRVESYSIRDHKHGKRIVIDLKEAPMFEHQQRVIYIHGDGRNNHAGNHPHHKVRVYVNPGDDQKVDKSQDQDVTPPPPPPPPPAAQPDKTTTKKPKI